MRHAGTRLTLENANGALSSAIDDYARSNGPTDELLAQIAPAARGDLILVFTFAGKLPVAKAEGAHRGDELGAPGRRPERSAPDRRAGGGRRASRSPSFAPADPNELDISASLFSVAQGRSVGLVAMQYSGDSVDDAIAKFAAQLAEALPQARCEGWDWTAKIDAEHLRQMHRPISANAAPKRPPGPS